MTNFKSKSALLVLSAAVFVSCLPRPVDGELGRGNRSRISSITMPIPDKLKGLVGPSRINAYALAIIPGTCDPGVQGTKVDKGAGALNASGGLLANEKLRQGCSYTLTLSLGRADSTGSRLEKIYLTNDYEGARTLIPIEKTRVSKIQVTAHLRVTQDGKNDLGIDDQAVPVPSQSEADAQIDIEIANQGGPQGDYDWRSDLTFSDVGTYSFTRDDWGSAYYRDVMTHTSPAERYTMYGPSTQAHETLHGLHNEMRNKTSQKDGFFYYEGGKGAYVVEPKENLRDVKNHIGASFRQLASSRYNLYLVEQTSSWTNTLYIFDEWVAYIGTTRSAVEIRKAGRWDPNDRDTNADPIEGLVDFMYFCSASLKSIKNVDPQYLATNKQFKAAFAMIMEESVRWMSEARKEPLWANSKAWAKMQNFQTAADGEQVRAAVRELMGEAWTRRVLGF